MVKSTPRALARLRKLCLALHDEMQRVAEQCKLPARQRMANG